MSVELHTSEAKAAQGAWRAGGRRGLMPWDRLRKALLFNLPTGRMRRMRPGWGC